MFTMVQNGFGLGLGFAESGQVRVRVILIFGTILIICVSNVSNHRD